MRKVVTPELRRRGLFRNWEHKGLQVICYDGIRDLFEIPKHAKSLWFAVSDEPLNRESLAVDIWGCADVLSWRIHGDDSIDWFFHAMEWRILDRFDLTPEPRLMYFTAWWR